MLADKPLSGNAEDWANLISRFGGNGLALKLVGDSIRQVFGGDIGAFLGRKTAPNGPGSRSKRCAAWTIIQRASLLNCAKIATCPAFCGLYTTPRSIGRC